MSRARKYSLILLILGFFTSAIVYAMVWSTTTDRAALIARGVETEGIVTKTDCTIRRGRKGGAIGPFVYYQFDYKPIREAQGRIGSMEACREMQPGDPITVTYLPKHPIISIPYPRRSLFASVEQDRRSALKLFAVSLFIFGVASRVVYLTLNKQSKV